MNILEIKKFKSDIKKLKNKFVPLNKYQDYKSLSKGKKIYYRLFTHSIDYYKRKKGQYIDKNKRQEKFGKNNFQSEQYTDSLYDSYDIDRRIRYLERQSHRKSRSRDKKSQDKSLDSSIKIAERREKDVSVCMMRSLFKSIK